MSDSYSNSQLVSSRLLGAYRSVFCGGVVGVRSARCQYLV